MNHREDRIVRSRGQRVGRGGTSRTMLKSPGAIFRRSVETLRSEGVRVLLGPEDGWEPHPPRASRTADFPWLAALELIGVRP